MVKSRNTLWSVAFCIIIILLVLTFPVSASTETDEPLLIYYAHDYEEQTIGDNPYGMSVSGDNSDGAISVVYAEKTVGDGNKALQITKGANKPYAGYFLGYAPIYKDFVLSFDLKQTDVSVSKEIKVLINAVDIDPGDYEGAFNIYFSDKIKIKDTSINANLKNGVWYSIDIAFDMDEKTAYLYVNGSKLGSTPIGDVVNISEFRIAGVDTGGDYLIDDFKLYESSDVLSKAEFDTKLEEWIQSPLCPDEKYEQGRLFQYSKFVHRAIYNKTVGLVNSDKIWKDNQLHTIKPIVEDNGQLMAPVEDFVKLFGADVKWNDAHNEVTINIGNKNLVVKANSKTYYNSGKSGRLKYPTYIKDESLYMSMNILAKFLNVEYKQLGEIIVFGDDILIDHNLVLMNHSPSDEIKDEVMEGIEYFLRYDRPTSDEILNVLNQTGTNPTILVDDFEWVNEGIEKDSQFAGVWNRQVIANADAYVKNGAFDVTDATGTGNGALSCATLALAYRVTKNDDYKNALWAQFQEIEEYGTLYTYQFLNVGTAAYDLGRAYAWIRDSLDAEQERRMREFIYNNVLLPFESGYMSPVYGDKTAFALSRGNQSIIINNGGIVCAIALSDFYPKLCSEIISNAIRSVERSLNGFGPDGGWEEGYSYWLYTCGYLPNFIEVIEHTFGTDFGLTKTPGLLKTINYALAQKGSTGGYACGDSISQGFAHGMFMWTAKQTGNPDIAALRKNHFTHESVIDLFNWVFDTENCDGDINNINPDIYLRGTEEVSMRQGWNREDTSILFHGGGNNDVHGHIDIGSFQFDMLGVRWATELAKEEYGSGIGEYSYRNGAEGHNVVVADISNDLPTGMVKSARGEIIEKAFSDTMSYAVMDLTQSNDIFSCGRRAVMLDKVNNQIIVQDSYSAKENTDFWWFMHLQNTITEIINDGKTVIMTKPDKEGNNQSITATIISGGNEKFVELEPKHLAAQGYEYDTAVPDTLPENEGFTKLAVQSTDTNKFKLTIVFKPYEDETLPINVPMERWKAIVK